MRLLFYRHGMSLLWLVCVMIVPTTLAQSPLVPVPTGNASSLRTLINNIHCANNSTEAAGYLQDLREHSLLSPGLPDEAEPAPGKALRASTLDKALLTLAQSANKFPQNKILIEQTVVQWNFCTVVDNGTIYDHQVLNGSTKKYPSALARTHHWDGFRQFGLLPEPPRDNTFTFSSPYKQSTIKSLAAIRHQQRYIDHCLPHPDNNHLYRNFGKNFISRNFPTQDNFSPLGEIEWTLECSVAAPLVSLQPNQQEEVPQELIAEVLKPQEDTNTQQPDLAAALSIPATNIETNTTPTQTPTTSIPDAQMPDTPIPDTPIPDTPMPDAQIPDTPMPEAQMPGTPIPDAQLPDTQMPDAPTPARPSKQIDLTEKKPLVTAPQNKSTPFTQAITRPWSGDGAITSKDKSSYGLSGSISVNNSAFLSKNTSVAFSVSYKPIKDSYWFVRSGFNISQESKPLTYSWGIGYDDWHKGTWGIQLNHWGPLQPGDGLDLNNAIADLNYKFKSHWLENHNLSSSVSLTYPLASGRQLTDSVISWGWAWNPRTHWFIRSTLRTPITEGDLTWSYGFGYTKYNNNSLSFEYNNWGSNKFPELNFRKNALVSLIYRWAF